MHPPLPMIRHYVPSAPLLFAFLLVSASAQESLENAPLALETVVVTGSPLQRTLFEQAQPVSVLTGDRLKLRLETTLGETLNREPGITSTQFAPGASRPIIRGLGDDRIRILNNGVNTLDVANVSPDHQVSADPLTIETIEVVRGPATLLYGPNTVGGVVNVIDNRIATQRLERPLEGKVEGRFGTADEERSGAASINIGFGPIVLHLDGFKRETQDIHIPGFARSARLGEAQPLEPGQKEARDVLPNSFVESEGGAAGATYLWDSGYVGASYSGINSNYGSVAEPEVTIDMATRRWDARAGIRSPFKPIKSIDLKYAYSDYTHTEFEGPEVGTVFEIEGHDGRLDVVHEKLGPLEGALGYQFQQSHFSALGAEAFLPAVRTEVHSAFLFEEIAWEKFRLQFGARYDHQGNDSAGGGEFGAPLSREFDTVSGSIGAVYAPNDDYAVALSVGYTQRAPTYVELFANGPHVATNSFEVGDPSLGLEESLGIDLSVRKRTGRVTGSLSAFYYRFSDFISAVPTGAFAEAEEEGEEGMPIFAYEAVDADFLGGEAEVTFHLLEPRAAEPVTAIKNPVGFKEDAPAMTLAASSQLDLELKADYVHTRVRGSDDSLPRIPPFRAMAALNYQHDRFSARVEGVYAASQDRTAENELPTDSYFLLNASIGYKLAAGPVDLDLYIKGTNLTNEEARMHTSFLKDIAPLAGRGVLCGVKLTF